MYSLFLLFPLFFFLNSGKVRETRVNIVLFGCRVLKSPAPLPTPLDSPGWRRAGHSSLLFEITELTSVNVFGEDRWRWSNVIGTGIFISSRFLSYCLRFSFDWFFFFTREIFQLFFNGSILFSFFFSFLFPFICTALFILNVKIKIWYHLKFEDIGICICVYRYMCYTCHVQIFFVFFIQTLCRYLLISFFFLQEFLFLFFPLLWI